MRCKVCQKAVRTPSLASREEQICGKCRKERNGDLRSKISQKASATMTQVWQERKQQQDERFIP